MVSGNSSATASLSCFRNSIASRFSRPPRRLGIHSPCFARVVEVEHRGDGVDAQPVGVVAVEPAQGAGDEERADLAASVVEDRRRPVGVVALAWIGVLVEVRAVEAGQPVLVDREVRGHPVEDHADAALVQPVDQRHQVLGCAVAGGRREVAGRLVPPRAVERVLHHRQQLDVGEAVGQHVVGERVGELGVGGEAATRRGDPAPRAEVHLVDRDRPGGRLGAPLHPCLVGPVVGEVGDHRGRRRWLDGRRADRVDLLHPLAEVARDDVAVGVPDERTGDVPGPDPRPPDLLHALAVPAVEVAEHLDRRGVRRPHGEPRAGRVGVGAEAVVQVAVGALVEQEQVELADRVLGAHRSCFRWESTSRRRRTSLPASTSDVGRGRRRRHVDGRMRPGTLCGAVSPHRSSTSTMTR